MVESVPRWQIISYMSPSSSTTIQVQKCGMSEGGHVVLGVSAVRSFLGRAKGW